MSTIISLARRSLRLHNNKNLLEVWKESVQILEELSTVTSTIKAHPIACFLSLLLANQTSPRRDRDFYAIEKCVSHLADLEEKD